MVLAKTEQQVSIMLSDTIIALCRNTLQYKAQVRIEGLLGITIDDKEIFLVHLNERINQINPESKKRPSSDIDSSEGDSESGIVQGRKRKHRRRSKRKKEDSAEEDIGEPVSEETVSIDNEKINQGIKGDDLVHWNELDNSNSLENIKIKTERIDSPSACSVTQNDPFPEFAMAGTSHSSDGSLNQHELQELTFPNIQGNGTSLVNMSGHALPRQAVDYSVKSQHPEFHGYTDGGGSDVDPTLGPSSSLSVENQGHPFAETDIHCLDIPPHTDPTTKLYSCNICRKTFVNQGNLKIHKMIHSGEKPHQCIFCGKSFVQKTNLTIHMRIHTGEKPYQCNICERSFAQKTNLKGHMRTHLNHQDMKANLVSHKGNDNFDNILSTSSEQQISSGPNAQIILCPICQQIFHNNEHLMKHIKVTHSNA